MSSVIFVIARGRLVRWFRRLGPLGLQVRSPQRSANYRVRGWHQSAVVYKTCYQGIQEEKNRQKKINSKNEKQWLL